MELFLGEFLDVAQDGALLLQGFECVHSFFVQGCFLKKEFIIVLNFNSMLCNCHVHDNML